VPMVLGEGWRNGDGERQREQQETSPHGSMVTPAGRVPAFGD
jgi:hypothetical protein